ncbi:aconitate hydratase B, partial [Xanthomonas citri pv. citri]|nr:aconitate hydratase B [Xanthomonas citri pv. citri]
MGDVIDVYPYKGEVRNHETGELLATFELKTDVLIDEVRAGGRIPLIIGRGLTTKAREALGLPHSDVFRQAKDVAESDRGFSLAQKMVGRACGVKGIRPGAYCEPKMTSVGSQD